MTEYMYDVTQYTCNDGNIAKILIPNNVTEDDLRGLYELLQVVAVRRFGLDLSEREAVQGWIPCSERLPECGFGLHYLVTLKDGHDFMDDVYEAFFDKYGWHVGDNELAYDDVIAWMPLPEPYKGGDSE